MLASLASQPDSFATRFGYLYLMIVWSSIFSLVTVTSTSRFSNQSSYATVTAQPANSPQRFCNSRLQGTPVQSQPKTFLFVLWIMTNDDLILLEASFYRHHGLCHRHHGMRPKVFWIHHQIACGASIVPSCTH